MVQPSRRREAQRTSFGKSNGVQLRLHSDQVEAEVAQRVDALLDKLQNHTAVVGIVGLGYVGLPFAVEKAKVGFKVLGIEQNIERAERVNRGENYIPDINDEELRDLVQRGLLEAVTDYSQVPEMDVIVIAVPTPLTKNLNPDLQFVENVTRELSRYLRPGQLISLESTTYPGTTQEIMLPLLEASGLKVQRDFFLAHSPERVDPGNARYTTKNTNKVVGGVGPHSHKVAVAFYQQTIENVVPVSSAEAAELVKVFENTFRAVNIALVNELTILCDRMGLNVWEVLDAAFTKPFGIMPFYPGPGVGGHCIPLDPHYLEWKAREYNFNTHFIALAGEINRGMPRFVREKAHRVLNQLGVAPSRSKILILGVSYKKDLGDYRESPALEVIKLLEEEGATVVYHDPYVPGFDEHGLAMESVPLTDETLKDITMVIITADHSCVDYGYVVSRVPHVLDTRNATKKLKDHRDKITLLYEAPMTLKGSRILLIGGAGFVGSHIVSISCYRENPAEIRVLDNLVRGKASNLAQALPSGKVTLIEGSLTDKYTLRSALQGVDYVFHLAALWLGECVSNPRAAVEVNVVGTYNVIEGCQEAGVKRIVYSSSASVYGNALSIPMTEDHPFNNRTMYGATKIAGEQFFRAFHDMHKLNYSGLRYMNVYGPRMDYKGTYVSVIMKVLDKIDAGQRPVIHGDGSQAYDFVHVEDVARCNILAMRHPQVTDEFFNVGKGTKTTINELVRKLLEITGSSLEPEYHPQEHIFVTHRLGSTDKAEKLLGFKAVKELDDGLRSVVAWRRQDQQATQGKAA